MFINLWKFQDIDKFKSRTKNNCEHEYKTLASQLQLEKLIYQMLKK
jgi:hypothetical protein